MTPRPIALVLAGTLSLFAACTTSRPSEDLACSATTECTANFPGENRQCMSGYCVVVECPTGCTTCDPTAKTCDVQCTSADACGNFVCAPGYSCTVNCMGDNACRDITCGATTTCNITCASTGSCGDITCKDACQCDLSCATGACGTMSCPTIGNGANQVRCTTDGDAGSPCDSSHDPSCARC